MAFNPNANNPVFSIVVQPDGKIIAGGNFTSFSPNGGAAVTRNNIARINLDGTLDTVFNPNAGGQVDSLAVQSDGKILVGGIFLSIAAAPRHSIARLETNGSLDNTLDLNISGDGFVTATALQPDGKILIGGAFTGVLGVPRNNIARLNADGTLDADFNPNADNSIYSIALQADGKILIGGTFTNIGGLTRNFIARLDATTGEPDLWNPNANNHVYCIVNQPNGKILVGDNFTNIGGLARNRIVRFDSTTGALDTWNPSANGQVLSIALEADGKILAGGSFTNIGGQARTYIARLNPTTGAADSSLNTSLNSSVIGVAVQQDGRILASGNFTQVNGAAHDIITRLNQNGTTDFTFNPRPNAQVLSMVIQSDGKIVVGGNFNGTNSIGGETRNYIARLNTNGTSDAAFNPNANAAVNSITVLPNGKILAGGRFTTIGGQMRNYFARLSNDTAALQNLVITQTTVTWTRDGASPQLSRVVFEQSTDGVNYTLLGDGTANLAPFSASEKNESQQFVPTASNWTLTGLNLPTGQNIYIRARGYYRGGYFIGSDSVTETVKNVFLIGPTAAVVSVSGAVFSSKGAGVSKAIVTLNNSHGQIQTALSNSFGFYRFDNVTVGETYIFTVSSKRYQFTPLVLAVNEEIVDLNFTAVP